MIKGKVLNADKVFRSLTNLSKGMEKANTLAVQESTLVLHKEAINLISANQGGRQGRRYNPKRNVTISTPGNPPHTDTGRLRQSIKFEVDKFSGRVGSNLKYAAWLEFGTEDMAPRPWLSTAISNTYKSIEKLFVKYFDQAVKETK